MEDIGHKRVKGNEQDFQSPKEKVFKIDTNRNVNVKKGEVLDIDLDCKEGFTVFIPYADLFEVVGGSDQIFKASLIDPPDVSEPLKYKLWRVRIQRKNKNNPHQKKNFAYCIYTPELNNFAVAASPPKMNLNP